MEIVEQIVIVITLSAVAIICLRYPELFVRFLARRISIDDQEDVKTPSQDVARLVRQDSQVWKIKYPQLANFIKVIGYVAIMFLLVLVIGIFLSLFHIS